MDTNLPPASDLIADKDALIALVEAQNRAIGLVRDPADTAEQSGALILAEGIRPEDCVFSCGILSARERT